MRREQLAPGEFFHIFNRGNNKQNIFVDERDRARLLFLILYFQSQMNFYNIGRQISNYVKHRMFNIEDDIKKNIVKNRYVELINFVLMPNHFHLTLCELKNGGISKYMQRILNSYTKYFNTKHDQSGHLFQGPYKMVHIKDNNQLLYLSTYIHRNPREIKVWANREDQYPWSSYQDYIGQNRWGEILKLDVISTQFISEQKYKSFVKTSPAKSRILDEQLILED